MPPIKQGQDVIGSRTKVRVVKNKVAPPFKEVEFDLIHGEGISREGDVLDLAVEKNIVEKSGTWYAYQGQRIGQGRENAKQFLKENPKILEQMEKEILEQFQHLQSRADGMRQRRKKMDLNQILVEALSQEASDVHIKVGSSSDLQGQWGLEGTGTRVKPFDHERCVEDGLRSDERLAEGTVHQESGSGHGL